MSTLIAFVAAYFVLLALLSLLARPLRARLKTVASGFLDQDLTDTERKMILRLADTAYSVRTAPVIFLVFVIGLLQQNEKIDKESNSWAIENPTMASDRRSHQLLELHMASAAAVNPIFGALAYAAKWLFRAKAKAYFRRESSSAKLDVYEMRVIAA